MKKRSFILGLVFLMFVSSVVYPNRVKDTEQSWEEEEDRSIISSPTLSIDENKFLNSLVGKDEFKIFSNSFLVCIRKQV